MSSEKYRQRMLADNPDEVGVAPGSAVFPPDGEPAGESSAVTTPPRRQVASRTPVQAEPAAKTAAAPKQRRRRPCDQRWKDNPNVRKKVMAKKNENGWGVIFLSVLLGLGCGWWFGSWIPLAIAGAAILCAVTYMVAWEIFW